MNDTLTQLGKKFGTDKYLHNYLSIYSEKFEPIRNNTKKVLEIGVEGGCSLKMWDEYFPSATIYGVDILDLNLILDRMKLSENSNIQSEVANTGKIKIMKGDISQHNTIEKIKNVIGDEIDIIIDDGSHISKDQIYAFGNLFLLLKDKGYYIIEDINTITGYGVDTVSYLKSLITCSEINNEDSDIIKNLYSVEFFNNIIIIRKGKPETVFYYL